MYAAEKQLLSCMVLLCQALPSVIAKHMLGPFFWGITAALCDVRWEERCEAGPTHE